MDKVHYMHFRFKKPRTVRAVPIAVTTNERGKIFLGAAACSVKDLFCKKNGRNEATKRLETQIANYVARVEINK